MFLMNVVAYKHNIPIHDHWAAIRSPIQDFHSQQNLHLYLWDTQRSTFELCECKVIIFPIVFNQCYQNIFHTFHLIIIKKYIKYNVKDQVNHCKYFILYLRIWCWLYMSHNLVLYCSKYFIILNQLEWCMFHYQNKPYLYCWP